MSRILLLGPHGQVGWELRRSLAPLGELVALDRGGQIRPETWNAVAATHCALAGNPVAPTQARAEFLTGDLSRPQDLVNAIRKLRPDVIVNAAAYTAVDRAESEPELARLINATAPGVLAREAAALGITLIHYSTDYVFNGSGVRPWSEDDSTGPLNVYGRAVLEGEKLIQASGCRHLILRTSWAYGSRGTNFANTILRLAAEREELRIIADQFGAPTGADLIADVTAHALRAVLTKPALVGVYHLAAAGETSWFDYARYLVARARATGWSIKVASDRIIPIRTNAYRTPAKRPLNSRLNVARLEQAFGLTMPAWEIGVARFLDESAPT